ncbi:MAG: superoxide dismutase family protein [Desulfobacterales bacterium]|nr:superoxide dismutase family protein [Desulfobacterales bacterium]
MLIHPTAKGLPPGPKAIHIRSVGTREDADKGFAASKGHLNPDGRKHGPMNPEGPDAGDPPNLLRAGGRAASRPGCTPRWPASTAAADGRRSWTRTVRRW